MAKRLIVGISGASGIIYGIRLLELLSKTDYEIHLVVTKAAQQTRSVETKLSSKALSSLAQITYHPTDMTAAIASGSFITEGMIVAPCSMKTLACIANGISAHLLARAADVSLKERRKLILMVRETPFHLQHIENMRKVTEMGAIVAPPLPAFYNHPATLDDIINHSVGRILDLFNFDLNVVKRWGQDNLFSEQTNL